MKISLILTILFVAIAFTTTHASSEAKVKNVDMVVYERTFKQDPPYDSNTEPDYILKIGQIVFTKKPNGMLSVVADNVTLNTTNIQHLSIDNVPADMMLVKKILNRDKTYEIKNIYEIIHHIRIILANSDIIIKGIKLDGEHMVDNLAYTIPNTTNDSYIITTDGKNRIYVKLHLIGEKELNVDLSIVSNLYSTSLHIVGAESKNSFGAIARAFEKFASITIDQRDPLGMCTQLNLPIEPCLKMFTKSDDGSKYNFDLNLTLEYRKSSGNEPNRGKNFCFNYLDKGFIVLNFEKVIPQIVTWLPLFYFVDNSEKMYAGIRDFLENPNTISMCTGGGFRLNGKHIALTEDDEICKESFLCSILTEKYSNNNLNDNITNDNSSDDINIINLFEK